MPCSVFAVLLVVSLAVYAARSRNSGGGRYGPPTYVHGFGAVPDNISLPVPPDMISTVHRPGAGFLLAIRDMGSRLDRKHGDGLAGSVRTVTQTMHTVTFTVRGCNIGTSW